MSFLQISLLTVGSWQLLGAISQESEVSDIISGRARSIFVGEGSPTIPANN
ncbi:hypothetical protein QUA63_10220 [Microcoleus sp. M2_D2]